MTVSTMVYGRCLFFKWDFKISTLLVKCKSASISWVEVYTDEHTYTYRQDTMGLPPSWPPVADNMIFFDWWQIRFLAIGNWHEVCLKEAMYVCVALGSSNRASTAARLVENGLSHWQDCILHNENCLPLPFPEPLSKPVTMAWFSPLQELWQYLLLY